MLVRYSPFSSVNTFAPLFRELDSFFQGPWRDAPGIPDAVSPQTDVYESDEALELRVDLPGHDPKQIQVELHEDVLTVRSERKAEVAKGRALRGERSFGLYARSFVLPPTIDGSAPEARYDNGVLTITLAKKAEAQPRQIEVKVK